MYDIPQILSPSLRKMLWMTLTLVSAATIPKYNKDTDNLTHYDPD